MSAFRSSSSPFVAAVRKLFSARRRHPPRRATPRRLQLECLEDRITPSVTVTTTLDPTTPIAGQVSLREAINMVNAGQVAYNTIILPAGTYQNVQGALNVTHSLILQGAGSGSTILDGGGTDRVVLIDPTAAVNVQISGVTIRDGNTSGDGGGIDVQDVSGQSSVLSVMNSIITGNSAGSTTNGGFNNYGGGIGVNNGDVNVLNSQVTNNQVMGANGNGYGGGIGDGNEGTGNITVTDSLIAGNTAGSAGGGIGELQLSNVFVGALTVTGSTIRDNTLTTIDFGGGGIFANTTGAVNISNTIIQGNISLTDGGGFEQQFDGPTNIVFSNDTIDDNQSTQGNGGGIAVETASNVTLQNSTFSGNTAASSGGGVEDEGVTLTATNSSFDNNKASNGNGGGIDVANGANQTATLTNVSFRGNSAAGNFNAGTGDGGALNDSYNGPLTFISCLLVDNTAALFGGGVSQPLGTLIIRDSQFTGNVAGANGGGLDSNVTTYTISGSTFNNNQATGLGGGMAIGGNGNFVSGLSSLLVNDSFAGNTALQDGGLGLDGNQPVTLINDTITGNSASGSFGGIEVSSPVSFQNTIAAGNSAANGPDMGIISSTFTDNGGNLIGNLSGFGGFTSPLDLLGGNPLLGPLADNGGILAGATGDQQVVQTEALLPGSPAIGKGVANGAPTTDERGFNRISPPDIGAFQFQNAVLTVAVAPATPTVSINGSETFAITVTNTSGNALPADNSTLAVTLSSGLTTAGPLTFVLAVLAAGQSQSFTVNTSATTLGTQMLTATVASADANTVSNSATVNVLANTPLLSLPPPATHTPVGGLTLFGFGFGPTGLDLFEIDSQGDVFAQGFSFAGVSGAPLFVAADTVFTNLALMNGAIVADLVGSSGPSFLMEVLNFTDPFVFQGLLAALFAGK